MRNIFVSTDVFAALWVRRQKGEDSENAVLERLLGLPKGPELPLQIVSLAPLRRGNGASPGADGTGGIYNMSFDVHFPAGFEIFRTYKGQSYSAVVKEGRWVMNGTGFPSLFALSTEVSDSNENPWGHWKYRKPEGEVRLIKDLRNRHEATEGKVGRRKT